MYKNCLLVIMRGFLHGLWTTEPRGHVPGANTNIWTQELTPLASFSFTSPPLPCPLPLNLCLLLLVLPFLPSNGTNIHNCSLKNAAARPLLSEASWSPHLGSMSKLVLGFRPRRQSRAPILAPSLLLGTHLSGAFCLLCNWLLQTPQGLEQRPGLHIEAQSMAEQTAIFRSPNQWARNLADQPF